MNNPNGWRQIAGGAPVAKALERPRFREASAAAVSSSAVAEAPGGAVGERSVFQGSCVWNTSSWGEGSTISAHWCGVEVSRERSAPTALRYHCET